jgi:predicted aspartyl protease
MTLPAAAAGACKILQVAEMPVNNAHNRALLTGEINGQPVTIQIDTGTQYTFVWAAAARRLGLPVGSTESNSKVYGVGGATRGLQAQIGQLQIGSFADKGLTLLAIDGPEGANADDPAMVLGDDFFSSFSTEFDLQHGVVRLLRPKDCQLDQLAYWAPSYSMAELHHLDSGQPQIRTEVTINGTRLDAILDTGATSSSIERRAAERVGILGGPRATASAGTIVGLANRPIERRIGIFDSFSIGDETIRDVRLGIAEMFGGNKAPVATGSHIAMREEETPAMLIGWDFFRAHRILVLPREHKLLFTYNGGPPFQAEAAAAPATGEASGGDGSAPARDTAHTP